MFFKETMLNALNIGITPNIGLFMAKTDTMFVADAMFFPPIIA